MKASRLSNGIMTVLIWGTAHSASGQGFTEKYTYEALQGFWQQNLGQANLASLAENYKAALVTADLTQSTQTQGTTTTAGTGVTLTILGMLTSSTTTTTTPPSPRYLFHAMRLSSGMQNQMLDRQVKLQSYLTRAKYFDVAGLAATAPAGSTEVQNLVATQQRALDVLNRSAHLELYYINIARSAQASSLQAKCRYLNEAEKMQQTFLDARGLMFPNSVMQAFSQTTSKPLGDLFPQVYERYKDFIAQKIACASEEIKSETQILGKIESTINSRVITYLNNPEGRPRVVLDQINGIVQDYEAILADIQVDPKTKELLALERNVTDVQSNLSLVKSDQLKVDRDIVAAEAIDLRNVEKLSSTNQKPAHPLISRVYALRLQLVDVIKDRLAKIEAVHTSAGTDQSKIIQCKDLTKSYQDMMSPYLSESNNDAIRNIPNTSIKAFSDKYTACLTQLTTYVDGLKTRTAFDEFLEQFAARLGELSNEVLRIKSESEGGL